MALTRNSLKAMGLTNEQVESIVEMHAETVDGLKGKLKAAEENASELTTVKGQLEQAKKDAEKAQKALEDAKADGWKEKHDLVKKQFDDYKADVTAKETKAAKEKAVREYFEGKSITGKNLDLAMRAARAEIDAAELQDGKIKDVSPLDELVSGTFSGLVSKTSVQGAQTATPPAGGTIRKTKDEIFAIKDRSERQKAIAENLDMFS